jgi:hypothetical protein
MLTHIGLSVQRRPPLPRCGFHRTAAQAGCRYTVSYAQRLIAHRFTQPAPGSSQVIHGWVQHAPPIAGGPSRVFNHQLVRNMPAKLLHCSILVKLATCPDGGALVQEARSMRGFMNGHSGAEGDDPWESLGRPPTSSEAGTSRCHLGSPLLPAKQGFSLQVLY